MNLYLLRWETSGVARWETYEAFVCAAETEEAARAMHPSGGPLDTVGGDWATKADGVTCVLVGKAADGVKAGPVLAAFIHG